MGQESRNILAGFSASDYLTIKVLTRSVVPSEGSTGDRHTSKLTHVVIVREGSVPWGLLDQGPQLLTSCWLKAALRSLPHGHFNVTACSFKARKLRRQEKERLLTRHK